MVEIIDQAQQSLGSGLLVAQPLVHYLLNLPGHFSELG